jgi:hypothetical protein
MSFQAYLDAVERKTGLTPRQLVEKAHELAEDYGLGRGHAMAMVHVITTGEQISGKHVDSGGTHSDPSDRLWLDGIATNPDRTG